MLNRTFTRADLVRALAREVGLPRSDCAEILEEVLGEISGCLARGEPVKVNNFATFSVRHKKARMGRNPKTGEEAPILARKVVKFSPSDRLKLKVNASSKQQRQPLVTNLRDDPTDIAEYLIQESGIEGAIQEAYDGTMKAQKDKDNYALSVWREVKTILRNKKDASSTKTV
jgi:integration host factor subunit alpha